MSKFHFSSEKEKTGISEKFLQWVQRNAEKGQVLSSSVLGESSYPFDPGGGCRVINNLMLGDSGPRLCCHLSPLWGAIVGTSTLGGGYRKFYTHNTPSAGTFIHVCRSVPGICLCLQQLLQTVSGRAQGPTCALQAMLSGHVHTSRTAFLCGTHTPILSQCIWCVLGSIIS